MSKEKSPEFYEAADAFIALANEMAKSTNPGNVSASFLYAAARFNTFIAASGATSAEEFASQQRQSKAYFLDEYEKMLNEHYADYLQNYDSYLATKPSNQPLN